FPVLAWRAEASVCAAGKRKDSMSQFLHKQVPVRLGNLEYEELRERVLRRDGWRCQFCGSRQNLEVHHQQFRSRCGEDSEANLITLCTECHLAAHGAVRTNT